jgi:hypothetical protein
MLKLTKILAVGALLAAVVPASAFIEDESKRGQKPVPETSQEQRAAQQALNGARPVVGEVPEDTTPFDVDAPASGEDGKDVLTTVQSQAAKNTLKAADSGTPIGARRGPAWWWGLLAFVFGLLSILVVRQVARDEPKRRR